MKHELAQKAVKILEATPDLAIATLREDGFPQATTVSYVHDGLMIYIGVGAESQKAQNMIRDPRVSLTATAPYDTWNDIRGVSMAAEAREMTTPEEISEVGQLMLKRFPQIAEMAEGDAGAAKFFRLNPIILSVLDYSLGFGHADTVAVDDYDVAESLQSMQHKWLTPID